MYKVYNFSYVTCWSICDCKVFDQWLFLSETLDHSIFSGSKFKLQLCVLYSWFVDFCSSEVNLIPWLTVKDFDCLIHFWSRSQTLQQGTDISDYLVMYYNKG